MTGVLPLSLLRLWIGHLSLLNHLDLPQGIKLRAIQENGPRKISRRRELQPNQEGQLEECLKSLRTLAGKGFPNRLHSRLHVWHQFHCGGLASISQTSTFCLHVTSTVTLLRQEGGGYGFCHSVFSFHSKTILLYLLEFRQPNKELKRWSGKRIILAGRCQDPKARFKGALLGCQDQIPNSFFFSSHTRARRSTGLWPYHPKCDCSHLI